MYEEERRFSWTNLFIKIIVAIIIILFIVWLLSLTNKKVSNKLDIITDNIFSENVEKLKTAGKEYFTTDRLPKKVGQIEKVTLEKLYNEKILLSLKDKKGNYCLSKKSYVSVEKMEKEYKMRVYLDCGDDKDYIIFPLEEKKECTINTCDKEKEDTTENKNSSVNNNTSNSTNTTKNSTTTNNTIKNNTNTSKTSNNNTNSNTTNNNNTNSDIAYKDTAASYVTTINDFRCDKKTRTWVFIKSCQSPSIDGAKCSITGGDTVLLGNLTNGAYCSTNKPGSESNNSNNNNNNNNNNNSNNSNTKIIKYEYVKYTAGYWTKWSDYSKWSTTKVTANDYRQVKTNTVSEPIMDYKLIGNPTKCPEIGNGYKHVSTVNGICNYEKENTTTVNPKCPKTYGDGYVFKKQDGFNCTYEKTVTDSVNPVCKKNISNAIFDSQRGFNCYYKVKISDSYKKYVGLYRGWTKPSDTSKIKYEYVSSAYRDKYENGKITKKKFYIYNKYEVVEAKYDYEESIATCPNGGKASNGKCVKTSVVTITKKDFAKCENSTKSGNQCLKKLTPLEEKRKLECSTGKLINGKCYATNKSAVGYNKVTYYSYRTRQYIKESTSYEYSTSNNDTYLLNLGYKLTGKTV